MFPNSYKKAGSYVLVVASVRIHFDYNVRLVSLEDKNFICASWQINLRVVTELGKEGQAERLGF